MMKKIFWAFLSIGLLTMALSGCSDILPSDDSQKEGIPTTGPETPGSETPGNEIQESQELGSESSETFRRSLWRRWNHFVEKQLLIRRILFS